MRETQAEDNWCQKQGFQPTIKDNNGIGLYNSCFMIQKSELECNIDTLFIKPALISIVREFTKNKKNVEIAEPVVSVFDETDDTITVIVYLPVLEIAQ